MYADQTGRNLRRYFAGAPLQKPRGFLFLRRRRGERIVVIDRRSCTWVKLLRIDAEQDCVHLKVDGVDEAIQLSLFDESSFLQGAGTLRLHAIEEHEHLGYTYASIGVRVPRELLIRREELIRGLSREELLALAS